MTIAGYVRMRDGICLSRVDVSNHAGGSSQSSRHDRSSLDDCSLAIEPTVLDMDLVSCLTPRVTPRGSYSSPMWYMSHVQPDAVVPLITDADL